MDISRLLQIIYLNKIAHPELFCDVGNEEKIYLEELLDDIEPDLMACCEDLGLPYIRPVVSGESAELLLNSFTSFIKTYVRELRATCRSGMNFVML